MALHGSASANLSPILFKGNNRALGVNIIIHQDESASMDDISQFYNSGVVIGALQDALLAQKIGTDVDAYPNLYAYFGVFSRNASTSFAITNSQGVLNVNQAFMRGEASGSSTISNWISNYFANSTTHVVNICTDLIGNTIAGRLTGYGNEIGLGSPKSEDVHGSLWSIYTTPNAISTGFPGRYGEILSSNVRKNSTTVVITNSDEQTGAPGDMINQLVAVNSTGTQERIINTSTGELITRGYRIISLSSYNSTDGYDGVLFYGFTSPLPYGYVNFSGSGYTITRSSVAPNWTKTASQIHDTLTIASETRGALFKIRRVYATIGTLVDNRVQFSNCLAQFIADTV